MQGSTIPHQVWGHFGTAKVFLIPARPGTGIKAGEAVRAVVESAGVTDILTKCFGSTNPINTWTGCITDRTQSYDETGDAPSGVAATLFPAALVWSCTFW